MSVTRESVLYDDFGHSILIRRRRGLKQLRIAVAHDGRVTVTAAQIVPFFLIQRFVERKREWITRTQESFRIKGYASRLSDEARRARFLKYRSEALVIVTERVQQLSQEFECSPGNITIRDQRTRWGSCSARGALSFNYRIVFLPEHLVDYIVVHELCHLRELNHGPRFWRLLESILPDAELRREELRSLSLLDAGHGDGL